MPWTEEEKQAEKERVTKISDFRVAAQDLLAEIDPDAVKARNDRWEAEHGKMTRQERMEEELQRAMVWLAPGRRQPISRFTSIWLMSVAPRKSTF